MAFACARVPGFNCSHPSKGPALMPANYGTRTRANYEAERPTQSAPNNVQTRDVGKLGLVTAVMNTTQVPPQFTAPNGTYTGHFNVGDTILCNSPNNDGYFQVTGIDTVNGAFLNVDPPPSSGGGTLTLQRQ